MKTKYYRMNCTLCGNSPWHKDLKDIEMSIREHQFPDHVVKTESSYVIV